MLRLFGGLKERGGRVPACSWFHLEFVAAELLGELYFLFPTPPHFLISMLDWGYGHAMVGIVKFIK